MITAICYASIALMPPPLLLLPKTSVCTNCCSLIRMT